MGTRLFWPDNCDHRRPSDRVASRLEASLATVSAAIAYYSARSGRVNELDAHVPRAAMLHPGRCRCSPAQQGDAAKGPGTLGSRRDSLKSHTDIRCQPRHKRCHGRRDHHLRLAKILGAACSGQGARHGSAGPHGASEDDAASARGMHTQFAHSRPHPRHHPARARGGRTLTHLSMHFQ